MVDKIAQLRAILWLLCQLNQDTVHVKEDHLHSAKMTFASTSVITTHGKRHLGATLGSTSFVESYDGVKSASGLTQ